jgi:hypothetical protein
MSESRINDLAGLLAEATERHHATYAAGDGFDPEWPLWYAHFLQAQLGDRIGEVPTRSRLVHLLVAAKEAFSAAESPGEPWERFYAAFILDHLSDRTDIHPKAGPEDPSG